MSLRSLKWLLRDIAWWIVAIVEVVGFFLWHLATSPKLQIAGLVIMVLGLLPTLGPAIERVREWDRASDPRNKHGSPPEVQDDLEE